MNHQKVPSEGAQKSSLLPAARAINDETNDNGKVATATTPIPTEVPANRERLQTPSASPSAAEEERTHRSDRNDPAAAATEAEQLTVTIVSARYAPCEGQRLPRTGELVPPGGQHNPVPYTRDVTPFVRALLIAQKRREDVEHKGLHARCGMDGTTIMVDDSIILQMYHCKFLYCDCI
jgi:hypothetical protein